AGPRAPSRRPLRGELAPRASASGAGALRSLSPLLDRYGHHVSPLGPRAVVVLHAVMAEELVQDEPGVGRALADTAVGDDVIAVQHARAAVQVTGLVRRLERAVLPHRLSARDRGSSGDGAPALRSPLLVP